MTTVAPVNTPHSRKPANLSATPDVQVVEFSAGIPGFEMCRRFVVIALPATVSAQLSAVARSAGSVVSHRRSTAARSADNDFTLREFERARLGAAVDEALVWLAIVTVALDGSATANLRAPVVINARRMVGCQFIRDDHEYPVRFPLTRDSTRAGGHAEEGDEAIVIGDGIEVRVLRHGHDGVRLGITAPPHIAVHRQAVYETIRAANASAAADPTRVDRAARIKQHLGDASQK